MASNVTERVARVRRREKIGLGLVRSLEYDQSTVIANLIKSGELAQDSALDDEAIRAALSRVLHSWTTRVLAHQ